MVQPEDDVLHPGDHIAGQHADHGAQQPGLGMAGAQHHGLGQWVTGDFEGELALVFPVAEQVGADRQVGGRLAELRLQQHQHMAAARVGRWRGCCTSLRSWPHARTLPGQPLVGLGQQVDQHQLAALAAVVQRKPLGHPGPQGRGVGLQLGGGQAAIAVGIYPLAGPGAVGVQRRNRQGQHAEHGVVHHVQRALLGRHHVGMARCGPQQHQHLDAQGQRGAQLRRAEAAHGLVCRAAGWQCGGGWAGWRGHGGFRSGEGSGVPGWLNLPGVGGMRGCLGGFAQAGRGGGISVLPVLVPAVPLMQRWM